jgi:hypothetical protein
VVTEICGVVDPQTNCRRLSKDQKDVYESSLVEFLRRGRDRGLTGTKNREKRRNKTSRKKTPSSTLSGTVSPTKCDGSTVSRNPEPPTAGDLTLITDLREVRDENNED